MRVLEIRLHKLARGTQPVHELLGELAQHRIILDRSRLAQMRLQIPVDPFIRVLLRRIRRQEEQLDASLVEWLLQPCTDHLGMMHPQVVHDQEHLALGHHVMHQGLHEVDEPGRIDRPRVQREAHLPLIA